MSFDDMLLSAVSDIEVPDALSPENIKNMLDCAAIVQEPVDPVPELIVSEKLERMPVRTKRVSFMRSIAAIAACAALAGGVLAMNSSNASIDPIAEEKTYEAVQQPSSYDELYSIYSGIYNSHELSREEIGDGEELITGDDTGGQKNNTVGTQSAQRAEEKFGTVTKPADSTAANTAVTDDAEPMFSDLSNADIVQSTDSYIYYLCDGTVYTVDKSDMSVVDAAESEYSPFEMDIYGDTLLLISRETDEYGDFVCAEIYDISDGTPVPEKTYRQDGRYISARTDEDGVVCMITSVSKSSRFNGDLAAPLDSFVPWYYVDGVKSFVEASDIFVTQNAADVDYTVVSSMPLAFGGDDISVKAVLGGGAAVFCTDNMLYVASVDNTGDRAVTYITSFGTDHGNLNYLSEGSVKGALRNRHDIYVSGGLLRVACLDYDTDGESEINIYSLDSLLNVVSQKTGLMKGSGFVKIRFEGSVAWLSENGELPVPVDLDTSDEVTDVSQDVPADETPADIAPVYTEQSAAVGTRTVSVDRFDGIFMINLTDSNGTRTDTFTVGDLSAASSAALTDSKAIFTDPDRQLAGIPVSGSVGGRTVDRYYLFSVVGDTLTQAGMVEFDAYGTDTGFDRAVIEGEDLILMGTGKMATVDLYTFEIKDMVTF